MKNIWKKLGKSQTFVRENYATRKAENTSQENIFQEKYLEGTRGVTTQK